MEEMEVVIAGCYKFLHGRVGRPCVTCPRLNESIFFVSNYTRMRYKMSHRLTCKSSFVVYLVTCKKQVNNQREVCGRQYTGSTTETMGLRHGGHRVEVREKSTPLGRHFAICGIENFSLQIIDCVKEGEKAALEILEGFWQHRLATFAVHGNLNHRDEMTRKRKQN